MNPVTISKDIIYEYSGDEIVEYIKGHKKSSVIIFQPLNWDDMAVLTRKMIKYYSGKTDSTSNYDHVWEFECGYMFAWSEEGEWHTQIERF